MIGILFLLIVSTVTSMGIGYQTNPATVEKNKQLNFDSYHISEIYNNEKLILRNDASKYIKSDVSVSYKEITSPSNVMEPMNSSWPMYCHDVRHTGQSPYSTANTTGMEKWRCNLEFGSEGGPVIDKDGTIYVSGDKFCAINPNGTIKWTYNLWSTSAATIDKNGTIYVGTYGLSWTYLYAFNQNGSVKWHYNAGNQVTSSPAIGNDGTIYFGDWNGYVNALYSNGTLRWRYQTLGAVLSSPAIGNDGTIYCGSHDNGLYAFYPNNGTVKWRFGTGGWVRTAPCIAEDGTIYCVSLDNYLYAVSPNGTMKWRTFVNAGTSPTIGQDGTIYAGWDRLYAVNPRNGSVKWVFDPGPNRCIEGGAPCHSSDNTIYFGTRIQESNGGEIIAVNPNGTERWRKLIANIEVQSAPAIDEDGTVYIGSTSFDGVDVGYLHAFGPGEQKNFEITNPKSGHRYFFGKDLGSTLNGNIIIFGSDTIQLQINSEDEIEGGVSFLLGTPFFYYNQYTDPEPPYEWNMDKRYAMTFIFHHDLTVVANYKGGCQWSETIQFWYLHFRNNKPEFSYY